MTIRGHALVARHGARCSRRRLSRRRHRRRRSASTSLLRDQFAQAPSADDRRRFGIRPRGHREPVERDGTVGGSGSVSPTGTISITTGAPVGFKAIAEETTGVDRHRLQRQRARSPQPRRSTPRRSAVKTKPARAKFTHPVTFTFSGFKPGKQIYAHFLHPKPVARERFGKAKGVCGVLKTKALLYPGGHPRFKTYKLQFDDSKAYSRHASPRIDTKLNTFVI